MLAVPLEPVSAQIFDLYSSASPYLTSSSSQPHFCFFFWMEVILGLAAAGGFGALAVAFFDAIFLPVFFIRSPF
jgi:hypothetical protein